MPTGGEAAAAGKRKVPEPSEAMVTPDKRAAKQPAGSTASSAAPRRSLFCSKHTEDQAAQQDAEECTSKPSHVGRSCSQSASQGRCSAAPREAQAACKRLFGICASKDTMAAYFENQVRKSHEELWARLELVSAQVATVRWMWIA